MIVQNIGTRALSMYIDSDELSDLGLSPEKIGQHEANQLLRKALNEKSLKEWKAAEMEVYPGKDSILLFVRRKSTKPCYFSFSDFEALISACKLCKPLPSSLIQIESKYLLTVYPFEGDNPPAILSEYGTQLDLSTCLAIHYEEQGQYIFMEKAIALIQKYFK